MPSTDRRRDVLDSLGRAIVTGEMTPVASLKSIDFRGSPGRVAGVGVGGKMLRSEDAIEDG